VPEMSIRRLVSLENLWNGDHAASLASNPLELLRYRSNLLGEDLRITNFGGGNTSAKFELPDPLTGVPQRVLAVKGSGGDLRSIAASGFALLYLDKLEALIARYRGEPFEDEMVALYPLCAFGENRVAASIDTPLHAFVPFPHVDHLHPDWAIALAASANGANKLQDFKARYGRRLAWLPWQRPGRPRAPVGLGPLIRVNAIAPATVIAGSTMFPRDRVIVSLKKYAIAFDESESTEILRAKLAAFYARRTITQQPILPADNANAICWLAGGQSAKTTGHVIPVDGGLPEAFFR
jgi:hypothetical protein